MRCKHKTVCGIFLNIVVDLSRYRFRRADEVLACRHLDDELPNAQFFALGDFPPDAGGFKPVVDTARAALRKRGRGDFRVDLWKRSIRVVGGEIAVPYLLQKYDRVFRAYLL